MDDQTRFWIAQEVADSKYTAGLTPLFRDGKASRRRMRLASSLLTVRRTSIQLYDTAYWRENKALAIRHVQDIRFEGQVHNNKMERMNGELRTDREKVVAGVKREDSPLIAGLQIYHNYVRPHMALQGRTPAEAAGIKVEGENRWLTLIRKRAEATTETLNVD